MFICSFCRKSVGPKVKPTQVVVTRPKLYKVVREVELIGPVEDFIPGYEPDTVYNACPTCMEERYGQPKPTVHAPFHNKVEVLSKAEGFQAHARKCKGVIPIKGDGGEKIGERPCPTCERGQAFFASLPAHLLNEILEDRPAVAARVRISTLIAEAAFIRSTTKSKRAQADATTALALLRPYAQSVGAIA